MKHSILMAALLIAACGGDSKDSTTNPLQVVTDDQPTATETSVAPTQAEPTMTSSPEPMQQPTVQGTQPVITAGTCVDTPPVGDGFGWNGVESCTPPAIAVTPIVESEAVPVQVTAPYDGKYETYTLATWPSVVTDSSMCPEIPLDFPLGCGTNGWVLYGSPVVRAVLCEDPDMAVEDPSNPGFFYDPVKGETCSKTETISIPTPEGPVEFADIGVEVLYENGNQWSCIEETRPSMDVEFEAEGTSSVTYDSGRSIPWQQSTADGGRAHLTYEDDTLTLYRSGLSRRVCDRQVVENYPFTLYGADRAQLYRDMWSAFIGDSTPKARLSDGAGFSSDDNFSPDSDLAKLGRDQLVDQTMQCRLLYETSWGRTGSHYRFGPAEGMVTIEPVGDGEYNLVGDSEIESQYHWVGNWEFYRYADDLTLLYMRRSALAGSTFAYDHGVYACETSAVVF